jgi:hypothetical protein
MHLFLSTLTAMSLSFKSDYGKPTDNSPLCQAKYQR